MTWQFRQFNIMIYLQYNKSVKKSSKCYLKGYLNRCSSTRLVKTQCWVSNCKEKKVIFKSIISKYSSCKMSYGVSNWVFVLFWYKKINNLTLQCNLHFFLGHSYTESSSKNRSTQLRNLYLKQKGINEWTHVLLWCIGTLRFLG